MTDLVIDDRVILNRSRTISISGEIDSDTVEYVARRLHYLNALNDKPVIVTLTSNGGDPEAGVGICGLLEASPAEVHLVAAGKAYSTAADMLALGPRGRRYITPLTVLLFHPARIVLDFEEIAVAHQGTVFAKEYEELLIKQIAARSKFSKKALTTALRHGLWLTASDCLKKGIADAMWDETTAAAVLKRIRGKPS